MQCLKINSFISAAPLLNFQGKRNTTTVILYDENNQPVKATLKRASRHTSFISKDEEYLGLIFYIKDNSPIEGDNYPDYYKDKDYIFIDSLSSTKKYKKIKTELVKSAVRQSCKQGLDGRVCLNASCTNKIHGTPVPFYYKLGFESSEKEKQEKIDFAMKNGEKIPKDCESTTMFLPKEKVLNLLG